MERISLSEYLIDIRDIGSDALIFALYGIHEEEVTVFLAKYGGFRRSEWAKATAELLQLVHTIAPRNLRNATGLFHYTQGSSARSVALLEFKFPLEVEEVEDNAYVFSRDSLEAIPNFFPRAIPIFLSVRIPGATVLGDTSGEITVPISYMEYYSTGGTARPWGKPEWPI